MSHTANGLEALCKAQPKFKGKGGLCVALIVTRRAKESVFPLKAEDFRTAEGGQVSGLGKAAVQKILEESGITKVLAEEGGRTSRGTLGMMTDYIRLLNELHSRGVLDLPEAERFWIRQVQRHFASKGPRFNFDPGKSIAANIEDLLHQAKDVQSHSGGTNYLGAMLQHLVGAKLELILGQGKVTHHGSSVADHSTARKGDFEIGSVAIHVSTAPNEGLIRKCGENLKQGFKPVIVTLREKLSSTAFDLQNAGLIDRVDLLDISQFLTANLYERSLFVPAECRVTLLGLLERYNSIVASCEVDPVLKVHLGS